MKILKHLKIKISLKAFNAFFFLSLFVIIFSSLFYQYNASNKITSDNFTNKNYNKSLEIREKFRTIFDKIEYQFIIAEDENKKKLNQLYELYKNNKQSLDLTFIENELNKNVSFGKYQVFLINKDYIIEKASYEKEIGLNLGQFTSVKNLFDQLFKKQINFDISSPKLDSESQLKRYLITLSDDQQYILQMSFSFDYSQEINKQLTTLSINEGTTNLYLATEFFIQDVNIKSKDFKSKLEQNEHAKLITKNFLSELNQALKNDKLANLSQSDTRKISLNNTLEKIVPLNEKLISYVDKQKDSINFYSSTGSLFGDNSATILFIKTSFPLKPLNIDREENKNTFLFITILVLFVLSLFEYFKNKEITLKITSITRKIKNNQLIDDEHSSIKDISTLIDSYNQMLEKLNKQLDINKELAYIDALTGIKNRKAYDEKIEDLISLYERYDKTFSIAIFDADDFKQINDTYGHSFGDTVLKEIAKTLRMSIRSVDLVYRIGGEEFIVIFPNSTLEESKIAVEKIRKNIDAIINNKNEIKITLSTGLTEVTKNDSKDSIFKKIDAFLYISKRSGKNTVTFDE